LRGAGVGHEDDRRRPPLGPTTREEAPMLAIDVIDSDGHVLETSADLAAHGWSGDGCAPMPARVLQKCSETAAGQRPNEESGVTKAVDRGPFDLDARLADMDLEGIHAAVNYPTALLAVNSFDDPADSLAACRAWNSWFARHYHEPAPERLFAAALVPAGDVPAAVVEARRAVTQLGAVTVMVPPFWREHHLCDPVFDPLWAALEELDVPAAIHNTRMDTLPHLDPRNFLDRGRQYAASFPFTAMVAMGDLALGGVLERFPRLRVVFLESSIAWMPSYIERLDDAYEHHGGTAAQPYKVAGDVPSLSYTELTAKPSDYLLSGNCFFSCEPEEAMFPAVVDALGEDQVVFASDYPHFDCAFPRSVEELVEESGLSPRLLRKVASSNSTHLYGIE
jgi:uncharacterized protein